LLPISPALLERPDDWPADVHLTGAWFDAGPPPPLTAEVEQFVSAGPFVYAGFGSMAGGDPVARARVILQSVRGRGERLLVARGLGGIAVPDELLADDVLVVRSAPHELILPHATAAVHHGGIGTTQAVLRAAAVPIVVPFIADQPFWGDLLHRRGLAPAPIPQRRLTAARLRKALDEAPAHREPVASAAERMARDGGTGAALAVISGLA
jgi:sterol 3beta-glucosyltransferase